MAHAFTSGRRCALQIRPSPVEAKASVRIVQRKLRMVLMKRLMMMAVLGLCAAGMLSGCNTVAGAGKDMQKAGSKVEGTAEKCSDGKC